MSFSIRLPVFFKFTLIGLALLCHQAILKIINVSKITIKSDSILSSAVQKNIRTFIENKDLKDIKNLYQELNSQYSNIESISIRSRSPFSKTVLINAAKPILLLKFKNNLLVFNSLGKISAMEQYHQTALENLPTFFIDSETLLRRSNGPAVAPSTHTCFAGQSNAMADAVDVACPEHVEGLTMSATQSARPACPSKPWRSRKRSVAKSNGYERSETVIDQDMFFECIKKLDFSLFESYELIWHKKTKIVLKSKENNYIIIADNNSILEKNKINFAQEIFKIKSQSLKKYQSFKIDIRFSNFLTCTSNGGDE